MHLLLRSTWPGNTEQLWQVLRRVAWHRRTGTIHPGDLPPECWSVSRRLLSPLESIERPAKVNTGNKTRGPLLLTAGGNDHTVPAAITTSTRKLYHKSPAITDFIEFPDRGHSLTIDHGWHEVAQAALDWLRQRSP